MNRYMISDYISFELPALGFRKVITSLTDKGYILYDVSVTGDAAFFRAKKKQSQKIIAFFDEMCYHYKIIGEGGYFFFARGIFKRKGLIAGILIVSLVLGFLNFRLNSVRIHGLKTVDYETVIGVLESQGIKKGVYTKNIDKKHLEYVITSSIDQIAFASVKISGMTMTINVYEELPPPDILDMTEPTPVKALKDGVITRYVVFSGTAAVKPGAAVRAGDVLIEPAVKIGEVQVEVRAAGDVYARVWYRGEAVFLENRLVKVRTGNCKVVSEVKICGFTIGRTAAPPFESYDEELENIALFGPSPVTVIRRYYYETLTETVTESFGDVFSGLLQKAEAAAKSKLPKNADILDSWHLVKDIDGGKVVEYYCEVEEKIS